MGINQLFTQQGMFPGTDRQITFSAENESRSEASVAINPKNPLHMIAVSKKFSKPDWYWFTVEPMVTIDGGYSWYPLPLPQPEGGNGWTDPVISFDHQGNAHLVLEPIRFIQPDTDQIPDIEVTGIKAFRLPYGGGNWIGPQELIVGRELNGQDDKPWIACDYGKASPWSSGSSGWVSVASPWKGNIYIVWGVGGGLNFARSTDAGVSWTGAGNLNAGDNVPGTSNAWAPEVTVGDGGVIHVVWHSPGSASILYVRSIDGGETFESQQTIVNGVQGLRSPPLPQTGSWPEFPGGKFRIVTLCTGCATGNRFLVSWSDIREGYARIYYHYSDDAGASWAPSSGQPLWPSLSSSSAVQQFHPQMVVDGKGVVGCAFYEFGQQPPSTQYRIRTRIMGSFDAGSSFGLPANVSDNPWDPAVNAPWAHFNPNDTFIGEYFGLDGGPDGFELVCTDTRTGVQELFYDHIATSKVDAPSWFTEGIVATFMSPGVGLGAGGFVIVGGKIVKVPPRDPLFALLQTIVTLDAARDIDHPAGRKLVKEVGEAMVDIVGDIAGEGINSRGKG
ncbi:MAG: sialidase family protein [Motiliproteus sp.]